MSFNLNDFLKKGSYLVFAYAFGAWLLAICRFPVVTLPGIFIIQQILIIKICIRHNCYMRIYLFFASLIMGMLLPFISYIIASRQTAYWAIFYAATFFSTWFIGRTINFVLADQESFNQPFIRNHFNRFFEIKAKR